MSHHQKDLSNLAEAYKYIIIGADAAGNSAVGQIRRNDKNGSIAMFEMGEVIAYGACGLPYAVSGKIPQVNDLVHFSPEGFVSKNNALIFTNTKVIAVDTKANQITVRHLPSGTEKKVRYEQLMIGTGTEPIRLPVLNYANERVFELKNVPDGNRLKNFIEQHKPQKIAVIGSGYIGLETAEAFREMNIAVDVYEALSRPVMRMPKFIGEAVVQIMKKNNITLFNEEKVTGMEISSNSVTLVTEKRKENYDLILSAVGIKPATGFLSGSEIQLDRGAIVIDRFGRTSVNNVWAGGDCALVHHQLLNKNVYYPLGHTANKQGRIAGVNMSGGKIEFIGIVGTQVFKFFDTVFAQTGLTLDEAKAAGYDAAEASAMRPSKAGYFPGAGKVKMSIVADQKTGQLLGAAMMGPLDSYGLIDTAGAMIFHKMKVNDLAWFDMAYAPPFAPVWNALISAAGKFTGEE